MVCVAPMGVNDTYAMYNNVCLFMYVCNFYCVLAVIQIILSTSKSSESDNVLPSAINFMYISAI